MRTRGTVHPQAGADRLCFRCCSTFGSTPQGDIGPVLHALMELAGTSATVAVPSFPAAGRTVYRGRLVVDDQLLSESPMRHHPLTPMRESDVRTLLQPQTRAIVTGIHLEDVHRGSAHLRNQINA